MSKAALLGSRPFRFLVAGGVNTALGLAFYPALVWLVPYFHEHYLQALGIAQVVCLLFAFFTYKLGVFRTQGNVVQEFVTFSSFYVINYAANWAVLPVLVELGGVRPDIAQIGFTAIVIFGSYFWHSRFSFRRRED
ncbi:GtrA family protein [Altererythrobacter sp. CC-YST694]|uniref:GtrA family protein n=1 Tax=Altererythrobacter sp. CC-YST694 TaxID=2755038 RepID=UPI001D0156F1|nr:GtrA family protein [Altererythrobacter sp. CC-YST694]MCB5425113.1 GtrA family protein [Altererythrobacter sp. CC-YST694]